MGSNPDEMDLLAMYHVNSQLDPDESKFRRYENQLLSAKNRVYGAEDYQAIREFHIVLGLIYVERDRWEQGSWKAAPYHLERAVSKTQQSEGRPPVRDDPPEENTDASLHGIVRQDRLGDQRPVCDDTALLARSRSDD